jgi:hypothetical protein
MEFEILQLMKQSAGTQFSDREIGKIMDRKEYRERPHWARPILEKMASDRLIWKVEVRYVYPTQEQIEEQNRSAGAERARSADTYQTEGRSLG